MRSRGRPIEIVVRAGKARWLGMPWELLRDPDRPNPVVLDGLTEAAQAGEPFQIVHFDGHGVLAGGRDAEQQGILVFESPGGGAHRVPAETLANARVPVVIINACQSGAVGKELEAAVAARLVQAGVAAVVAMAYTVYAVAVAAAEFTTGLYERLFAGDCLADAVSAVRREELHTRL